MSIINFNMLKIDKVNNPIINEEKIPEATPCKISMTIARIINNTQRTRTKDSLCINSLQKILYRIRKLMSDSLEDESSSNRLESLSGTIKITPRVIARNILRTVKMSLTRDSLIIIP